MYDKLVGPECHAARLGAWDIEKDNCSGVFIAPKMYALKDNETNKEEIKGKGIPAYMVTTDQQGIDRRIREG